MLNTKWTFVSISFYSDIISNLQKSYKKSTKNSWISFTQQVSPINCFHFDSFIILILSFSLPLSLPFSLFLPLFQIKFQTLCPLILKYFNMYLLNSRTQSQYNDQNLALIQYYCLTHHSHSNFVHHPNVLYSYLPPSLLGHNPGSSTVYSFQVPLVLFNWKSISVFLCFLTLKIFEEYRSQLFFVDVTQM